MITRLRAISLAPLALVFLAAGAPRTAWASDPTTADCLAANNSSVDLRNEHKLRAARGQLLICAATSCPVDVRRECLRRVDEINPQIPTIIFGAKDASGRDLSAVKVAMDGQLFADHLEGTALSADPGRHTFTFESEGQAPITRDLVILEAQKDRRESVTFGHIPAQAAPVAPPPLTGDRTADTPPAPGLGAQRAIALVVGGVGVAGLGVGGAFALLALSKKKEAESVCPGLCSSPDGQSKWNDAASSGNIATALLIAGGVGVVGAAVLWFTAKPASASATIAQVGFGPGSVQVRGTW